MIRRIVLLAGATLTVAALAGCAATPAAAPTRMPASPAPSATASPPPAVVSEVLPQGEPTVLSSGLTTPWSVAFLDGTPLVSSRDTGEILEVAGDGSTRVAGVIADVVHRGESGLLGLAVDDAGRLYAYSTGPDGNRVQRFTVTGGPGTLALSAPEDIVTGIPAASYHNGGRIAFGPDGMLYVTTGDAGDRTAAQDPGALGGKILRFTPDGAPADRNPFPGSPVWSLGHRNPQGIAWAADGRMFAAEFGQDTWDELNLITPGGNYGWPIVEGAADDTRFINPVQQWSPDVASPSGMTIAGGTLFIANLRGQRVRAVPVADPGTSTELYTGTYGRIRLATIGPEGALWLLTSNTDGYGDGPADGDDRILTVPLAPTS